MDEVKLEVGPNNFERTRKPAGALRQSAAEAVRILVPVERREEAIAVVVVIVKPHVSFVPIKQVCLGLLLERRNRGTLERDARGGGIGRVERPTRADERRGLRYR